MELYAVAPDEERRGVVALSCGGTVVLDDIAEIDGVDEPRDPWSRGLLEGVIDFPELHVAPGSRRGFAHDEPVAAFLAALEELERSSSSTSRRSDAGAPPCARRVSRADIRKAFRPVANRLPDYDFFAVRGGAAAPDGTAAGSGRRPGRDAGPPAAEGRRLETAEGRRGGAGGPEPETANGAPDAGASRKTRGQLFPPGPLAEVGSVPAGCGSRRSRRAARERGRWTRTAVRAPATWASPGTSRARASCRPTAPGRGTRRPTSTQAAASTASCASSPCRARSR